MKRACYLLAISMLGCGSKEPEVTFDPVAECSNVHLACEYVASRSHSHLVAYLEFMRCSEDLGNCLSQTSTQACAEWCPQAVSITKCKEACGL